MLTLLKDLFRPPARSAAPRFNPDDPCGDGWRRADLPEGRPVRFRLAVPPLPRTPPPRTGIAAAEKPDSGWRFGS
jgi:hypothetical protein